MGFNELKLISDQNERKRPGRVRGVGFGDLELGYVGQKINGY